MFAQDAFAYLCIAVPAMLPLLVWAACRRAGNPILPSSRDCFLCITHPHCCAARRQPIPANCVQAATRSRPFSLRQYGLLAVSGADPRTSRCFQAKQVADHNRTDRLHRSRWRDRLHLRSSAAAWLLAGLVAWRVRSIVLTLTSISLLLLGHYASLGTVGRPGWGFGGRRSVAADPVALTISCWSRLDVCSRLPRLCHHRGGSHGSDWE